MKFLKIAWKDFNITYRDLGELLLMIASPILMTLVMAFAFSGSGDGGFSAVPVGLVNLDEGMVGQMLAETLQSEQIQDYLTIENYDSLEKAQKELDEDKLGAIIFIPSESSKMMEFSNQSGFSSIEELSVDIDIFTNPVRPISGMIVEAVMDSILTQLNAGFTGSLLGFSELIQQGTVSIEQLQEGLGEEIGQQLQPMFEENESQINIETKYWEENQEQFSWMEYMAPSMAILFLGFSMTSSARSILNERENGTFGRLLASPTNPGTIIVGKMFGTFLIGLIQVLIFIVISIPLLGITWGPLPVVFGFTLVLVLASASWGIMIASLAKNSGQASALGMAVNLIFAAVAGNFVPRMNYPDWLQQIGYLTPNAWGIEGFMQLIRGGNFSDVRTGFFVLAGMAIVLLVIASVSFTLQYGQIRKSGGKNE